MPPAGLRNTTLLHSSSLVCQVPEFPLFSQATPLGKAGVGKIPPQPHTPLLTSLLMSHSMQLQDTHRSVCSTISQSPFPSPSVQTAQDLLWKLGFCHRCPWLHCCLCFSSYCSGLQSFFLQRGQSPWEKQAVPQREAICSTSRMRHGAQALVARAGQHMPRVTALCYLRCPQLFPRPGTGDKFSNGTLLVDG